MASNNPNTTSIYSTLFFLFTICFKSLTAAPNSSFSFTNFTHNPLFNTSISLYGDANVTNNGFSSSLQLGAGRVMYKNRVRFYYGNPRKLVSFSTYFSFSISSSGIGDGLAFVVVSDQYPVGLIEGNGDGNGSFGLVKGEGLKFVSVEFDVNGNHVGIDLSGFVSLKVGNLSSVGLGLNSGEKLQAWIDYESMSRRLEVRLTKFGENRPVDPLLFQHIDLGKIWPENEGFFVGLSSYNNNSSCNVYSWSFKTRKSPDWMHSEPLDPILLKPREEVEVKIHKRSDCVWMVLSALILGVGLGALGSFVGMFLWTIFGKRQPISPEEYDVKEYAVKPVVVHDKASANEKQ